MAGFSAQGHTKLKSRRQSGCVLIQSSGSLSKLMRLWWNSVPCSLGLGPCFLAGCQLVAASAHGSCLHSLLVCPLHLQSHQWTTSLASNSSHSLNLLPGKALSLVRVQLIKLYPLVWTSLCPPNSCVEALTPNVTIFEDRTFKEVIKVKWFIRVEC